MYLITMNKKVVTAPIDKLRLWRAGNWVPYDTKLSNLTLRIHIDQLLIASDDRILESLNMNGKLKGIFKQNVLLLVVTGDKQEVRKIKFQFKNNTIQVLQQLCKHFPVAKFQSSTRKINMKYRNIDEIFNTAINNVVNETLNLPMPSSYDNFVKLCLLDPLFPQIVSETQNILDKNMSERK